MIAVITCITDAHNLKLVLLAAFICMAGAWTTINLLRRADQTYGQLKNGWRLLTGVAAGSSIWCTHFVAILAFDPGVPDHYDPVMTMVSLLASIFGAGLGASVATMRFSAAAPAVGGGLLGAAATLMHYLGMSALELQGVIEWNVGYIAASVMIALFFAGVAAQIALRAAFRYRLLAASGLFFLSVVGLHFTGMAAMRVIPLDISAMHVSAEGDAAMALAVACVGLLMIGAGLTTQLIDRSMRRENSRQLEHSARHDAMTGLPNRRQFIERLDSDLAIAGGSDEKVAVIRVDLTRFKDINDGYGHTIGDSVLCAMAERMRAFDSETQFASRLGGDEFSLVGRFRDDSAVHDFVAQLRHRMGERVQIGGHTISLGTSIGVAIFPNDAPDRDKLLANADLAMFRAKSKHDEKICFYEATMDEASRMRRDMERDLWRALDRQEFFLLYQQQRKAGSEAICGYEALIRWRHPDHGLISPATFIPIAEECGAINAIGDWVLRTACEEAMRRPEIGKIAVNLSPVQLSDAGLTDRLRQILVATGMPPRRLELEVTESAIITDQTRALHLLRQIKGMGITIAIDDFGTGYSSLATLRAFPFDKIKLDRSFVLELESSRTAKAFLRAMVSLGHSLDVAILAEGVETAAQLDILRQEGCHEVQGYLFGRPAPLDAAKPEEKPADIRQTEATARSRNVA